LIFKLNLLYCSFEQLLKYWSLICKKQKSKSVKQKSLIMKKSIGVRNLLPDSHDITELSETFKVLGDPTRLKIVLALATEELCVCDLAALIDVSISAISHQLRLLRSMRLVSYRKQGKMVYYKLDDEHVENLIKEASRHVGEF